MSDNKTKRILIVEDEPAVRLLLVESLRMEGFDVHEASDGQKALDLLAQIPRPSLILTDFNMPNLNGAEFVIRKNQDDAFKSIPVIVLSSDPAAHNLVHHVHEVFSKPFDFDDLVWKIRNVIKT